jgi:hypothetical protein
MVVIGCVVPDVLKESTAWKTSATTHPTTQHHIPEDLNPQEINCLAYYIHLY